LLQADYLEKALGVVDDVGKVVARAQQAVVMVVAVVAYPTLEVVR
jgi:hypothetical protein